jgi:hypothetical protein
MSVQSLTAETASITILVDPSKAQNPSPGLILSNEDSAIPAGRTRLLPTGSECSEARLNCQHVQRISGLVGDGLPVGAGGLPVGASR